MRRRTVQRHRRADADTGDHETDLTDDVVAEKAAHIIFHDRIERPIERHEAAGSHEEVGPRKDADERIDSGLRGEGGKENGAGDGAFRICIDQPCIHRRDGRIHGDADEDRPEGQIVCAR